MLDTHPHVVEVAISDLAIGRTGIRGVSPVGLVGVRYPRSMHDSLEDTEFGRAHRLTVVDLRDSIAFHRTATIAPVESAQARGRSGVAR